MGGPELGKSPKVLHQNCDFPILLLDKIEVNAMEFCTANLFMLPVDPSIRHETIHNHSLGYDVSDYVAVGRASVMDDKKSQAYLYMSITKYKAPGALGDKYIAATYA